MSYDGYSDRPRSKKFRWLLGIGAALFVFYLVTGWLTSSGAGNFGNMLKVISLVRTQYFYPVETSKMTEGAIGGIVDSLEDPYSYYLDAQTYTQLQEQIKGSFGGLGILVGVKDNFLTVVRAYKDTPAYEAGIKAGDRVLKIEGTDARGMDLDTAVQMMRGPVGTKVSLIISRDGLAEPIEAKLTRQEISVPTVEGKMLGNTGIGYIVLTQFTEKTPTELETLLATFTEQGLKGVLLDLRDNPGGELRSVQRVAGNFIPSGPVLYIEYKGGKSEMLPTISENINLPLVVLINGGSASAAEILAGAVKDTGTGTLVGQKSFGKGVVQTVFELSNGAGLKLTTARYLTPGKNDINKKGIEPDVAVEQDSGDVDLQYEKGLEILKEKLARKAA